ncbi:MAG: hypothetical protein AAF539_13355 [Planctomycetota bacterium]
MSFFEATRTTNLQRSSVTWKLRWTQSQVLFAIGLAMGIEMVSMPLLAFVCLCWPVNPDWIVNVAALLTITIALGCAGVLFVWPPSGLRNPTRQACINVNTSRSPAPRSSSLGHLSRGRSKLEFPARPRQEFDSPVMGYPASCWTDATRCPR